MAKLLEQVRSASRARQFSRRTEEAYVGWIRRFVIFHERRHPLQLTGEHVAAFLTHLAVDRKVSASTQTQAGSALLFLYRDVLCVPISLSKDISRPQRPVRVPVVLTRAEVFRVLERVSGVSQLVCSLMYGSGARLLEALQLRVKDTTRPSRDRCTRRQRWRGSFDRATDRFGLFFDAADTPSIRVALQRYYARWRMGGSAGRVSADVTDFRSRACMAVPLPRGADKCGYRNAADPPIPSS